MAVTDPCKDKQPRVIDNELLYKCINSQFPKGEMGRLINEERVPLNEVEEIRLEFRNILRIDHLWVMSSLTKLQLNNNMIEKIENLEMLVRLKELDLSFNKISKIENMDTLTELVKVTFYDNLIKRIENMDNQKNLTVFSIGRNLIEDTKNIYYLRRFPKLTSLNMADNPGCGSAPFRYFVATALPNLVYYEYVRIRSGERETGFGIFEEQLKELQKVEDEENAAKAIVEKEKADAELHSLSFVEYLNSRHLFDQMFENDVEGRALLLLGDEVKEFHEEYQEQFVGLCKQVFDAGQRHYGIRKAEVEEFQTTVEDGKKSNQTESIALMETFIEKKDSILGQIKHYQAEYDAERISIEKYYEHVERLTEVCNDLMHDVWKELMRLELQLFEQVEEVNQNFGHILSDLVNAFLEEAQALIAQIRALEVNYFENVGDVAGRFLTAMNINDDGIVPEGLKAIMADREALVNALAASHDLHMQVIDNREDTLVNRAKNYVENFTAKLAQEEIQRNRYKLLEINHFLDIQSEELLELTNDAAVITNLDDLDF